MVSLKLLIPSVKASSSIESRSLVRVSIGWLSLVLFFSPFSDFLGSLKGDLYGSVGEVLLFLRFTLAWSSECMI